ncbi:hypothetical protein M569_10474 [Genlisea aurea]|uniref:Uncharacterized protein n=1 Tax=Genlisea aurea TaxID=192259 RepID=S8CBQ2_9LAMI|nr:hypothetical protein M569_10474 [Genlisea aurea]
MASILAGHPSNLLRDTSTYFYKSGEYRIHLLGLPNSNTFSAVHVTDSCKKSSVKCPSWAIFVVNYENTDEGGDDNLEEGVNEESGIGPVNSDRMREGLEKIVGSDDSNFSGMDLATLIRNKYGRSYDVQLIKKEFLGRNLLALNVMWKYMEQRSFPLTKEEYILRLDDVANTLKCWGAVSHVRNSLEKVKERPRIGKAVSIFIDMDESGERAKEWIYK